MNGGANDASSQSLPMPPKWGVVVIGRNEGQRLITCLDSISNATSVTYVDSNSTDGSVQVALARGIDVVELDLSIPFTAARARNAGFRRSLEIVPDLKYVQFIDGDCELNARWAEAAVSFLERNPEVAAVCGRLRERYPERSIYNWLCDQEWDRPIGEVRSFAGNVMMRVDALNGVGGYREDVIAAEEDELSVRLRGAEWRIWRLADEMALHDAAMTHFKQWWRRTSRAGYAFAQGAYLHGTAPELHFVRESRRAWIWGLLLPFVCVAGTVAIPRLGWALWLIYPMQFVRLTLKKSGPLKDRASVALFQVIARFPEGAGQAMFWRDRLLERRPQLIEHK